MSSIKRHMEDQEALRQEALDVCIAAGTIEECENHEGIYYSGDEEVQEAYKLANTQISRGDIKLSGDMKRRDFTDLVKKVYEESSASHCCNRCEELGL